MYSTSNATYSTPQEVILQGLPKADMVSIVTESGGEVTKEFKFINAISASLNDKQLDNLTREQPKLRVIDDASINVSDSTTAPSQLLEQKRLKVNVNKNRVNWTGVNNSGKAISIDALTLRYPETASGLKNVRINGVRYKANLLSDSGTLVFAEDEQITLAAGEELKIRLRFDSISDKRRKGFSFVFSERNLEANSRFKFDSRNQSVKWTTPVDSLIENVDVKKLELDFPEHNGGVKTIKINGSDTSFSVNSAGQYVINDIVQIDRHHNIDFEGLFHSLVSTYIDRAPAPSPEQSETQEQLKIEVAFDEQTSANPSDFDAVLHFENGHMLALEADNNNIAQGKERDTFFPTIVRADKLHDMGITGRGVGVAIIDTGSDLPREISRTTDGGYKHITFRDFVSWDERDRFLTIDGNGHGTHVTSIIANSTQSVRYAEDGITSYNGIAPNADLIVLRAFDDNGASSYSNVLASIEYAIENKDRHNIRVLNLSFSATPSSYYWDDPLNQLVMRAWQEGIVVVAASGNRGSGAMSVGVPGNTPYIITVGATSDNATPFDLSDDFVPTFSSAGPTVEGFIKPEIVAPGLRIQGLISERTFVRDYFGMFDNDPFDEHDYFDLSGTSQSAAVISGIVALMIENDPLLTPDEVKCRLMDTARIATLDENTLAYSVFQQGLGLVDAYEALYSTAGDCIDQTMSIAKDLAGEEHYIGPVRYNETSGEFEIIGAEGIEWNGVYNDSQLWRKGRFNSDSQLWGNRSFNSDSQLWRHTSGGFRSNSQLWRRTSFNVESQLWGNPGFDVNSQLWGNQVFNADSQLWGNRRFNSDSSFDDATLGSSSLQQEWIDHE